MYASPNMVQNFAQRRMSAGLYQQVGVESQLANATPHALVAMLFEGFMEALAQARGAIRNRDPAAKGTAIGRAVRILEEGLRAGLDVRSGGSLARDLDDLYAYITQRLTYANLRSDEAAVIECQRLMQPLHEAWRSIGSSAAASPAKTSPR
jgi:flagellar secretion chaperone FliS